MSQGKLSVIEAARILEISEGTLRNRMSGCDRAGKGAPRRRKDPSGRIYFTEADVLDWKRRNTKILY